MTSRAASSGSGRARLSWRPARIASIAASRRSIIFGSAMVLTQFRAQRLQRAPLKLFHRSLTSLQLLRDFADASSFSETHDDNPPLVGGQSIDQAKEQGPLLNRGHLAIGHVARRRCRPFAR